MGGKKGGKKAKGSSGNDAGDDDSTERLYNIYGKKCTELSTTIPANVREKFNDAIGEGEFLTDLNIWDPIGWQGAKALGDALLEVKYDKLKSLKLWKCGVEDNGLLYICNYLMINKSLVTLEIMDNGITSLGCEFLTRVLKKEVESPIAILKLDHNPIGSAGASILAEGLAMNPTLKVLWLNFCEIGKEGAKDLAHMLIYIKSALEELSLKGNDLENEGAEEILKAAQISKSLKKIILADNKIKESGVEGAVTKQICMAVGQESCPVRSYDFSYNNFDDKTVEEIVKKIEEGGLVSDFKLTIKMDDTFRNWFKKVLDTNKKKAKKAKKKKGKKSKKKK